MAFPIITLVFAALVAFFAFQTGKLETGMTNEVAPIVRSDNASTDAEEEEAPAVEETDAEEETDAKEEE